MGAPKHELRLFEVNEMLELLSAAKETAIVFRSLEARSTALEHIRASLLPFTQWLDKPITDCFQSVDKAILRRAPKRAMPVFERLSSSLAPVALDRQGSWITVQNFKGRKLVTLPTSLMLAEKIDEARYDILSKHRSSLEFTESLGLRPIVEHCAFLRYIQQGLKNVGEMLTKQEERLQTMRANLSFLSSFADGLDPLAFEPKQLQGFSVWDEHERGSSRCSGTYFVHDPVAMEVAERNAKQRPNSKSYYYVFESPQTLHKLEGFLGSLCTSIEETKKTFSSDARKPISEEEATVIKNFADSIGHS